MLPGHGSVFLQLSHRRRAHLSPPYDATTSRSRQRYMKCQNMQVVKNHPQISCSFKPPNDRAAHGMNQDDPPGSRTVEIQSKDAKMPPLLPECASALPGDVGEGLGVIMHLISMAPTPPQGVQWDSLGSFRAVGPGEWVDTLGGQKPPMCILSFKAPQPQCSGWNEQR